MTDILYNEDNIRVVRLSCTTFGASAFPNSQPNSLKEEWVSLVCTPMASRAN